MKNIIVDFESYYDKELSVTAIGVPNYVAQTEAYLVAVQGDGIDFCGSPGQLEKSEGNDWMGDPDLQFWAFNSNFDQALWEEYFPRTHRPWKCLSDLAAFHQLPRNLAKVSEVILGQAVDKKIRDRMKGVRFESLPQAEQDEVTAYCRNDVLVEKQLLEKLPPMTAIEDEAAAHTRLINRRGVHIDMEKVDRDTEALHRIRHDTYNAIPWAEHTETPLSHARFAEYCATRGVVAPKSLDKRDEACAHWVKLNPTLAPVLLRMRTYRGANTKLEKLKTLKANVTPNGVLPLEMLYCGARHTRRWSSVGFNVQNLDKTPVFAEVMAEWPEFSDPEHPHFDPDLDPGIFIRSYLVPPAGRKFGILDFSQIEPRCLNWLVSNDPLLEAIRKGFSYYEAYAGVHKNWRGKPDTLKADYGLEKYTKLKNEALGLGYGMGAAKYTTYARVPEVEAQQVVKDFRRLNPKITAFWRMLDQKIWAVTAGRDRTLEIEMPTGDLLRHFHVRPKQNGGGFESFTIRGDFSQASRQPSLWGGTLTENVTQRMARDILAEAILRLERAGFPVVFHAHDEVILSLDSQTAETDFAEAKRLMSIPPEWCPDLPLAADGGIFEHYTKM